jgi:DNA-binding MarR family transcriptional regulator
LTSGASWLTIYFYIEIFSEEIVSERTSEDAVNDQDRTLSGSALHKFLLIYRHLRRYARQMGENDVHPRQISVLRFLIEHGPATVGDIQSYLYTSASTASNLIAKLEEAGYATRTRSIDDNRVVIVEATPAGRKIANSTPLGGIGLLRARIDSLPEDRLRLIDEALGELMRMMEVSDEE